MIQKLRSCLEALAENADILPASGGAVQQLLQPDQEEKEDQSLDPEGTIDLFGESPMPREWDSFVPCPAITRARDHRFRYFLDGAMRSYFLCSASEHDVTEPVVLGEVGAVAMHRTDSGSLSPHSHRHKAILVCNASRFSSAFRTALDTAATAARIEFIDSGRDEQVMFNRVARTDPALRALGMIRWEMRLAEMALLDSLPDSDDWIIVDGSVAISSKRLPEIVNRRVIGIAKSFSRAPKFTAGRTKEQRSVSKLLAGLPVGHRTPVYTNSGGDVGFWYVRLWEQGAVDYPLMGVVKCDMVLPTTERVFDSELVTEISRCLVAERNVTPYGKDPRWHSHLYPIYIAEQYIRTRFQSPVMQREWLAREWSRILRKTT